MHTMSSGSETQTPSGASMLARLLSHALMPAISLPVWMPTRISIGLPSTGDMTSEAAAIMSTANAAMVSACSGLGSGRPVVTM